MTTEKTSVEYEIEERAKARPQIIKTLAEKYAGANCTLDGRPATICGRLLDYAIIRQLPNGGDFQWAWGTVARVMQAGGNFRS
jgi:hypothetical protein